MKLGIDTSTDYLIFTIFDEDKVIYHYQELCVRQQSEMANSVLAEIFKRCDLSPHDLQAVVCTNGPGSFTGLRIGLTIAKVMSSMLDIPFYTISTLQYYLGTDNKKVVLDARGKKVYVGYYGENGEFNQQILDVDEVNSEEFAVGDLSVLDHNKENHLPDLANNFIELRNDWHHDSALIAEPNYIKDVLL